MKRKIISAYLAFCMIIAYSPVYAAINRENLTETFSVSDMIIPEAYHACQSGEGIRNTENGPVVYSASEAGYEGYYITAPDVSGDEFTNAYRYMCTGARDEYGNRTEMYTRYIERNSYWVYMPTDGLLNEGEKLNVNDGVYFSFYYRSAEKFTSPADEKTYTGEDVDFKTCFVHNSGYGTTQFRNIETMQNVTTMKADGEWHRVEFIGQVNGDIIDRINSYTDNTIPFLICFQDLSKQSSIEMTGFRMGIMKVNQENTDNSYNRIFTEMSWHLSKNALDTITVNGTEINLIKNKYKYTVKTDIENVNITAVSKSGAEYEVIQNSETEYVIKVKSAGYDFTKAPDETVTYQEKVNVLGEYSSSGTTHSFAVRNADMYSQRYTIYLSDNIFDSPLRNIPETKLFTGENDEFKRAEYEEWVNEGLPENMVEEVLWGNIAFVRDSTNYWLIDEKYTASDSALILKNGEYFILSSIAYKLFNIKSDEKYVLLDDISAVADYEVFTDPRGFVMFSHHMEQSIDKSPVKADNIAYRHYKSYYAVTMAMGEITWNDILPTASDYEEFIKKREEMMLLSADLASDYSEYFESQISVVAGYMELFDETNSNIFTDNCSVSAKYSRLFEMAKCFKTLKNLGREDLDTEKLLKMILMLLEHLYNTHFSQNTMLEPTEDWFANLITYPTKTADTLMLIKDEISSELIEKYVSTWNIIVADPCVSKFQVPYKYDTHETDADLSNPCSNYTNLIWRSHTILKLNMLIRDADRINRTLKYLSGVFEYTKSSKKHDVYLIKDGFYEDGSFVFHSFYAYNTGYGKSYTAEMAELVTATEGTAFDVKNIHGYENVYNLMEKSWIPFITHNQVTKFASGRELPTHATSMICAMLVMLSHAPDDVKQRVGRNLKSVVSMKNYKNLSSNPGNFYSYIYPTLQRDIREIAEYIDVLPDEDCFGSYAYYNMDRVIHKRKDFTFMLAMSSERIDRYEAIQGHGYTDWYIGDGMTYTITDSRQYHINWWSGVDRYKIPGTTVDTTQRNPNTSQYGNHNAQNEWAGMASDGDITVAGMILPGNITETDVKLTGKKSYFMLDNEIVCMGSDINGGNGEVYTTVDNLWQENSQDIAVVDGVSVTAKTDTKEYFQNPKYVWTEADKGYVFIGENTLSCERAVNNKRYTGYNKTDSENTSPFMHILIEHGTSPQNGAYTYAILPDVTQSETAHYATNPDFEVISSDSSLHAIKIKKNGIIMANVFKPSVISGISFNTPCSVILKPYGNGYKIYISDPTQTQESLSLKLDSDKNVFGDSFTRNGASVSIDVRENLGKTYEITQSDFEIVDNGENVTVTSWGEKTPYIAAYSGKELIGVYDGTSVYVPSSADKIRAFYWDGLNSMYPEKSAETLVFCCE